MRDPAIITMPGGEVDLEALRRLILKEQEQGRPDPQIRFLGPAELVLYQLSMGGSYRHEVLPGDHIYGCEVIA